MKILYIDMDGVLVDFQTGIDRITEQQREEFEGKLDEVPGIFSLMDPMLGAIESFQRLANHYDTYILSTAPWENHTAWSDKLKWVKEYLGAPAYKRLILSHHKNLNAGEYLIDDRDKNGVVSFKGEHIHFRTERFPDWKSVCDYLL